MQIKRISTRKLWHEDSLEREGFTEFGNGLLVDCGVVLFRSSLLAQLESFYYILLLMHCLPHQVDVTKKNKEDFNSPPREGAYVHGLFMEGARWDTQTGMIAESRLKELTPGMPVMFIRAIPVDKQETKNVYECPVYKTRQRGPTYVWNFFLKTKESPAKWTLAGVALLLSA